MAEQLPRLYTVKEVAKAARQTPQTVYNHIEKGAIPARYVGGSVRISEDEAIKYLGGPVTLSDQPEK